MVAHYALALIELFFQFNAINQGKTALSKKFRSVFLHSLIIS